MRKRQAERRGKLSPSKLAARSQSARDRGLHVLAAMRRDPKLSLTHAAKLQGIKPGTVRKYFPSALSKSKGKFDLPVMMKLTLSTPHHALRNIAKGPLTRPHNFMMLPQICRFGYPEDVDPDKCTLITSFTSNRDQWMGSKCINIHDSQSSIYELTDEYDGRKALVKNFFMLLDSYQDHPEAKSVGPDGKPCSSGTRGLLQQAHVMANLPLILIGKEFDKHLEEGEDLSLLEFQTIQYRPKGNVVANDEQLARIAKVPKREFMRRGINQHTLEKICAGEPVRAIKLAKCLKVLENGNR